MAADLYTNIVLSDREFKEGVKRIEGHAAGMMQRLQNLGRVGGFIGRGLGTAGLLLGVSRVAGALTEIENLQARIQAGTASIEDRIVGSLPKGLQLADKLTGSIASNIAIWASGVQAAQAGIDRLNTRQGLIDLLGDQEARARVQGDDYAERAIDIDRRFNEAQRAIDSMKSKGLLSGADVGVLSSQNREIRDLEQQHRLRQKLIRQEEQLETARNKARAAAEKAQREIEAENNKAFRMLAGRDRLREALQDDQVRELRLRGKDQEADLLQHELGTRRRIADLYDLANPLGLTDAERKSFAARIQSNADRQAELMRAAKEKTEERFRVVGAGQGAHASGILAFGARSIDQVNAARTREAVERAAAEAERQTQLLESIDRGIAGGGSVPRYGR